MSWTILLPSNSNRNRQRIVALAEGTSESPVQARMNCEAANFISKVFVGFGMRWKYVEERKYKSCSYSTGSARSASPPTKARNAQTPSAPIEMQQARRRFANGRQISHMVRNALPSIFRTKRFLPQRCGGGCSRFRPEQTSTLSLQIGERPVSSVKAGIHEIQYTERKEIGQHRM